MILRDTLETLEFDRVLSLIARFSKSAGGRKAVHAICPLAEKKVIMERAVLVAEIRRLAKTASPLPISHFEEISEALEKVRPGGAILEGTDFLDIKTVLHVMADIRHGEFSEEEHPGLKKLTARLTGFPELLELLSWTFDDEGKVVDHASARLAEIRKGLKRLNARIGNRLKEIVKEEAVARFLQDDFITKRGERWVIPVRMDAKGEVAGVVHDVSGSGETAFMEPLEIIGLSNELGSLTADEKAEVIRILREVCNEIRQDRQALTEQYNILIRLDMLNSIAACADQLSMSPVDINDSCTITLRSAKHPLLIAMARAGTIREAVPLDVTLEGEDRVMVITGPNAGGKTIVIKTVGLLIVMAMAGLPIPAAPSSSLPFVANLLTDIGDEQSIDSSLSTFSGHISRVSGILEATGKETVVLLDEVGTGTEPAQGAAIACAVLNELQARGAIVFATTHLTDIIGFVYKTAGMVNASMEFDELNHSPLYRLKEGEPGQSHAIETAIRFGLPKSVTDFASKLMGGMGAEFHELLKSLKEKGARYDALRAVVEQKVDLLRKREEEIKEKLDAVEIKKRSAYEEGLKAAHEVMVDAKRQARALLEEGKKSPRATLARLEEKRQEIAEKLKEFEVGSTLTMDDIKEGDRLFLRTIGANGVVKAMDSRKARLDVESGGITFKVGLSDVGPLHGSKRERSRRKGAPLETAEVASSIKLLGLRAEAALSVLETYLDNAAMSGRDEVKIIHGVGTGALIKAVRSYLETHPNVSSFRRGEPSEGGDGVTVVLMK